MILIDHHIELTYRHSSLHCSETHEVIVPGKRETKEGERHTAIQQIFKHTRLKLSRETYATHGVMFEDSNPSLQSVAVNHR